MSFYGKLHGFLLESGLGEAEAFIYIELLKKPVATIWELVQRTGLRKSAVYRAFATLERLKMVEKNEKGIRALSLKTLVAELNKKERETGRLADNIRRIAPFLKMPIESIEDIETLYTKESIYAVYMFMSEINYNVNLDFGDFEGFVPVLGGLHMPQKFLCNRLKHATNHAILTSYGPYTDYFMKREEEIKNKIDVLNEDFKRQFVIFSDSSDYVMFNDMNDPENPVSVFVKSRLIADTQRTQFDIFSRKLGN